MRKFGTVVNDEVGDLFKAWCQAQGRSAYDVLSSFIHKVVAKERKDFSKCSQVSRTMAAKLRLDQLTAGGQRPPGASQNNRKRCCSEDCFSIENDRLKCSTTGTPSPYHVE